MAFVLAAKYIKVGNRGSGEGVPARLSTPSAAAPARPARYLPVSFVASLAFSQDARPAQHGILLSHSDIRYKVI